MVDPNFILPRMTQPDTYTQQIVRKGCISICSRFGCIRVENDWVRKREFVMVQYMLVLLSTMLKDRKGVSSLEYAVLAFAVIGAVFAALGTFSADLSGVFATILASLKTDTGG